jgi:ABC-type nitrate/sulfonate/bicarbonate transport system ATPase subunit
MEYGDIDMYWRSIIYLGYGGMTLVRFRLQVLCGVDMVVKPGMIVALVGASGCGKSTLLKLITKEYLQNSGFVSH